MEIIHIANLDQQDYLELTLQKLCKQMDKKISESRVDLFVKDPYLINRYLDIISYSLEHNLNSKRTSLQRLLEICEAIIKIQKNKESYETE